MNKNYKPAYINYKPIYIKCTEQNKGEKIIKTLESLGGINIDDFVGDTLGSLYYIKPNRKIDIIDPKDETEDFLNYFFNTAEEIKFPEITSEYCYVLDHNTGKIFKHRITEDEVDLTTEELLKKYGLNEDECSIMYTSNNLELELLED